MSEEKIKSTIIYFLKNRSINSIDVKRKLQNLSDEIDLSWRDLGDREANFSTVHMADSNESVLFERITNAIDAYIEKFAEKYEEIKNLSSPYKVIEFLKEKRETIRKDDIFVEIYNTDKYTNFLFWDDGIGLTNSDMVRTILSLNETNKFRKIYMMGAFGQGGSTACGNNQYTIIFSKKNNKISFTIIRYNNLDDDDYAKNGKYEYLVLKDSNLPPLIDFDDEIKKEFEVEVTKGTKRTFNGTSVFHVEFEKKILGRNFYKICDEILFNPAFNYTIGYFNKNEKTKESEWTTRQMGGLKRRLNDNEKKGDIIVKSTKSRFLYEEDAIIITYYYLKNQNCNVFLSDSTHPIFATFNGQIHGRFSKSIISSESKLPQLEKNLIVEVNCNSLSKKSRKKTFTTDRQSIKKKAKDKIKEEIIKFISNDTILLDENERKYIEETRKGLQKGSEEMGILLAKLLENNPLFGNIKITKGKNGDGSSGGKRKEQTPIKTKDFPTYVKIINSSPIRVKIGNILKLKIESDLSNETSKYYTLSLDEKSFSYIDKNSIQIDQFSGGRSNIRCNLKESLREGDSFYIKVLLKSYKLDLETDERLIIVISNQPKKSGKKGGTPEIITITKEEDTDIYKRVFDSEKKYAKYEETKDRIIIYINLSNQIYKSFMDNNRKKIKNTSIIKEKFSLYLAYACFTLQHSEEFSEVLANFSDDNKEEKVEKVKNESMAVSANTILQTLLSEGRV